jgi:hypothetical protein
MTFLIEMKRVKGIKIVRNEFDFVEETKEEGKDRTFFESESEILLNEMNFYREFLKLSSGG